jgi:hypothetical protein
MVLIIGFSLEMGWEDRTNFRRKVNLTITDGPSIMMNDDGIEMREMIETGYK